jgi:pimeloyl-ACP methyl ester carboxylesterase
LVLLHGSGATSAMWLGDVTSYAASHRVYAVDIPGEPGVDRPDATAPLLGAYTDWLGDVLDLLDIGRGATRRHLARWMARGRLRDPSARRVERLVLLLPSGIGRQKVRVALLTLLARLVRSISPCVP